MLNISNLTQIVCHKKDLLSKNEKEGERGGREGGGSPIGATLRSHIHCPSPSFIVRTNVDNMVRLHLTIDGHHVMPPNPTLCHSLAIFTT